MDEELGLFEQAKAYAREYYSTFTIQELALAMKEKQASKEEVETQLKKINADLDVLRFEKIPEKMDEEGIERITVTGVGRISLTGDMLVSTKSGMKEALFRWLDDNGLQDIIQPSINASTLKAFIKGRMKNGEEVPEDCLNITPITRASITKV